MTDAPAFNPILLDIPDQREAARLLLRAPRPGDGMRRSMRVFATTR